MASRLRDVVAGFPSYDMFGYKVTPMTVGEQLELITRHVEAREQCVMASLNLHGLHILPQEPEMLRLHRSPKTYVLLDGMPLVPLCRLAGIPAKWQHRVTNLDLIWPLLSLAEKNGWRIYYFGNSPEVLDCGIRAIISRLPGLKIRGHHGYVGSDSSDVVADIVQFGADFVIVGLGAGMQDRWIHENLEAIAPASVTGVGALMEYVAGAAKTPPRWMGRLGLEWLFRFAENPGRFWRRYLLEPWAVAWTLAGVMVHRTRLVNR